MKIAFRVITGICAVIVVVCIVIGNFKFDYRASLLVFSAIMATIGALEALNELDIIADKEKEGDGSNDDI